MQAQTSRPRSIDQPAPRAVAHDREIERRRGGSGAQRHVHSSRLHEIRHCIIGATAGGNFCAPAHVVESRYPGVMTARAPRRQTRGGEQPPAHHAQARGRRARRRAVLGWLGRGDGSGDAAARRHLGGLAGRPAAGRRDASSSRKSIRARAGVAHANAGEALLPRLLEPHALAAVPLADRAGAVRSEGLGALRSGEPALRGSGGRGHGPRRTRHGSRLPSHDGTASHPAPAARCAHRVLPPHPVSALRRIPDPALVSGAAAGRARMRPDRLPLPRLRGELP